MNVKITVLDVQFGDAVLIEIDDNGEKWTAMIDCGTQKYLKKYYNLLCDIKHFNCIIITHHHEDHYSGLKWMLKLKKFVIDSVIDTSMKEVNNSRYSSLLKKLKSRFTAPKDIKDYIEVYSINDKFCRDKVMKYLKVLLPDELSMKDSNPNKNSIVLYISIGDECILFMADATAEEELRLVDENKIPQAEKYYIKIGHHGSKTSSSKKFLYNLSKSNLCDGWVSCAEEEKNLPNIDTLFTWRNLKSGELKLTNSRWKCIRSEHTIVYETSD